MFHELKHGPTMGTLEVSLEPGEEITAEAGAMVLRTPNVSMTTHLNASARAGFVGLLVSFFTALVRKVMGGDTFLVNRFETEGPGKVVFAPALSGELVHRRLAGEAIILRPGAYLASAGDLDIRVRWAGLRGLFARQGLFFVQVGGQGDLWFSSYGAVEELTVEGTHVIDTGHVLAFDPTLDFAIRNAGSGALGFLASGEGLVMEFTGRGRVWVQTRNLDALVGWITPLLPP
ncbi:TIGR00266 family protein [Myxococcota bacterium]|nr:TIGR00266 family protein [Myxococcota bacterium]